MRLLQLDVSRPDHETEAGLSPAPARFAIFLRQLDAIQIQYLQVPDFESRKRSAPLLARF